MRFKFGKHFNPAKFHLNEGHAGFLALELIADEMKKGFTLERMRMLTPTSEIATEHYAEHVDKPFRMIPLDVFVEVRQSLEELFEVAQARGPVRPSDYVITRYRERNSNLRTQFLRIIKRAAVEPWPKLFQNLRSTRQTELEERFF